MKEVVCTVCSRLKDLSPGFLPARERYLGKHIALVREIAQESRKPFFILSGEYGLLHENDAVPSYDHVLREEDVESLTRKVIGQVEERDIRRILFYGKQKPEWQLYYKALLDACRQSKNFTLANVPFVETGTPSSKPALHLVR